MPWVRFTDGFDWKPKLQVTIAYQPGDLMLVTTRCMNAAIARGAAEMAERPRKPDGDICENHGS